MPIDLTPGQQALATGPSTDASIAPGVQAGNDASVASGLGALQPQTINGGATVGAQLRAKGSPWLKASGEASDAAAAQMPPTAPGATLRSVVAGAIHANATVGQRVGSAVGAGVNGLAAGLGDASHATDNLKPGQGWLSGVSKTMEARGQRLAQDKQQKFANDQESQKTRAQVAMNQATTMEISRNIQKQDEESRDKSATIGKSVIDAGRETHDTQDNIPNDTFTDMVQKNPDYMNTHYARITGYEPKLGPDGKQLLDTNNRPIESPTWSVQERAPKANMNAPITMTKAVHDDWVASGVKNVPDVGAEVPYNSFFDVSGTAHKVADTVHALNKDRNDQLTDEQIQQNHELFAKPTVAKAVTLDMAHGAIGGLQKALDNAKLHDTQLTSQIAQAQKAGNAGAVQKLQGQLAQVKQEETDVNAAYNTYPDKDKQDYTKMLDTEAKDKAEEAKDYAAAAKDKSETQLQNDLNPSGTANLTGDAYLKALPIGPQSVIRAIGEGREIRSPRQLQDKNGGPSALAIAVNKAFPDLDLPKLAAYGGLRSEFEKGKTATSLNGGGTALKHLNELQQLNTIESRNPLSEDYKAFHNKLSTVAGELLTFYGMPKTNESIADMKNTLGGTFNRDAAIKSQIGSMGDKLASYEQTWKNGQPRPSYTPPMPGIDTEAKVALIRMDPKFAASHPSVVSVNMKAPDGSVKPVPADQVEHFKSLGATEQ